MELPEALTQYYEELTALLLSQSPQNGGGEFTPGWSLPPLDQRLTEFFRPSTLTWSPLATYNHCRLSVLDLRSNPATRTTKTFASLLMVARAVEFVRRTRERVMIVTPSSANKATALRDAVWRAVDLGLVSPSEIQIVCLVPEISVHKVWDSPLNHDPSLRRANPVLTLPAGSAQNVKDIVRAVAVSEAEQVSSRCGVNVWFTLALDNYKVADAIRGFMERDMLPSPEGARVHAHSVSSAFGLLGHDYGQRWRGGIARSQYFLVQHLAAPDMVLDLYTDSFDRAGLPTYTADPTTGLHVQCADLHFPFTTHAVDENLDSTFYTHAPVTAAAMKSIIRTQGGGGIVVSLHECVERYGAVRELLRPTGIDIPADPRDVREWSLVMAMVGVLNGIDRKLLQAGTEVVVHASGTYGVHEYKALSREHAISVSDPEQLIDQMITASACSSR